ncbi:hypothetical protein BG000_006299 [Podila horticola]|nr:hypothetical protein BG000_006299 [Podila horticola]
MTSSSKKVAFKARTDSESDSESDSGLDTITASKSEDPDYYDPIYFDTDSEESDDDEQKQGSSTKKEDPVEPLDNLSGTTDANGGVTEITEGLKSSSLASPSTSTSKKSKKHAKISDADLLYDPDEDDRDENWLIKKIAENRPPGCKLEDIWTDAILTCPMCLTQLCFDCQRHEIYTHQYRAMFVEHCRTIETEVLRFAKETKRGKQARTSDSSISSSEPEFKPSADDEPDALYHPVVCEICNTKVALIDGDEVYHFFNIIPSPV